MERLARKSRQFDGPVLAGDRGKVYANPACTIRRRDPAPCSGHLADNCKHAVATQGKTDHQGNKNAAPARNLRPHEGCTFMDREAALMPRAEAVIAFIETFCRA